MTVDTRTKAAVAGLHKRYGVRGNLSKLFHCRLAELWGVNSHDDEIERRAKAIYRLRTVFHTLPDERSRRTAPDLYNLNPDPEMHGLDLTKRKALLDKRHRDDKYAARTLNRVLELTIPAIENSLLKPLPPIPDRQLQMIVQLERKFADELAGRVRPETFSTLVRRSYHAPMDDAVEAFLRLPVIVPRSHSDGLIIARTADQGSWLCIFSTEANQIAHQQATSEQPWSGHCDTMPGEELVHKVVAKWDTVGIVVDPSDTRSTDTRQRTSRTLRLPPSLLAQIASNL